MRRVLRPGGRLLFVEHGLAPDEGVRWWQDRLTPAWRSISGSCHLNRPIQTMIEAAGFRVDRIETGYMPGLKPMTFMYEGSARCGATRRLAHSWGPAYLVRMDECCAPPRLNLGGSKKQDDAYRRVLWAVLAINAAMFAVASTSSGYYVGNTVLALSRYG